MPRPGRPVAAWARGFVARDQTDTLSLLKDLGAGISGAVSYQSRDDEGVQTPVETLDRGFGSCRDFAVLFVEAARGLGFGARIVSGYLYNPNQGSTGSAVRGINSMPGPKCMCRARAGLRSIRPIAVSAASISFPSPSPRDIRQAMPMTGRFAGAPDAFQGMTVEVLVTSRPSLILGA